LGGAPLNLRFFDINSIDLSKKKKNVNWDFVLVEEVWFWGEMVLMDSVLYLFGFFFFFGEWHSFGFFSSSRGL
jgi:hypothetical protein